MPNIRCPDLTFPPKIAKGKELSSLLKRAHAATRDFNALLLSTEDPLLFLSPLSFSETIASLDTRKKGVSLKKLLSFGTENRASDTYSEILQYQRALKRVCSNEKKEPFTHRLICNLHRQLKASLAHPLDVGRYRNRQNWIGPAGCTLEQAYYHPPKHTHVRKLMHALLTWSNRSSKEDPLIGAALYFAQLLIIHPFMDGNGRIARILVPLNLYRKRVLAAPLLFVSDYFQSKKIRYYESLFHITENGSWDKWICFFLKGIISRAKAETKKLEALIVLKNSLPPMQKPLLQLLFGSPIFTLSHFKKKGGTRALLEELMCTGDVRRLQKGKYVFRSLIEKTSKS